MCGLIGSTGEHNMGWKIQHFLKDAMMCGAVRGRHSTGVIERTSTELLSLKRALNGTSFLETVYNPQQDSSINCRDIMIHNRYATVGGVSDETAHPFRAGNIVGMHNGTLAHGWEHRLGVPYQTPVDSLGLFMAIDEMGFAEAITLAEGAVALTWYDVKENRCFAFRNSERPLFYTRVAPNRCIYASEKGMLEWLLGKERQDIQHGEIFEFKADTLYELTDGKVKIIGEVGAYAGSGTPLRRAGYVAQRLGNRVVGGTTTYIQGSQGKKLNAVVGGNKIEHDKTSSGSNIFSTITAYDTQEHECCGCGRPIRSSQDYYEEKLSDNPQDDGPKSHLYCSGKDKVYYKMKRGQVMPAEPTPMTDDEIADQYASWYKRNPDVSFNEFEDFVDNLQDMIVSRIISGGVT